MANINEESLRAFDGLSPEEQNDVLSKRNPADRALIASSYQKWKGSRPSIPESIARGGLEGASSGYSGELQGFGNAIGMPKPQQLAAASFLPLTAPLLGISGAQELYRRLTGKETKPFADEYAEERNKEEKKIDDSKSENPKAFLGGELAGTVAQAAATPMSPKNLPQAVAIGGSLGGLSAVGHSKADLVNGGSDAWLQALKDEQIGSGIGAVTGALGYGAGKVIDSLGERAYLDAYKAAHPSLKNMQLHSKEEMMAIGKRLLKEKLIPFLGTSEDITENITPALQSAKEDVGSSLSNLSQASKEGIAPQELAAHLENTQLPKYNKPAYEVAGIPNRLKDQINMIKEFGDTNPEVGFTEAEEALKRPLQDVSKFDNATPGVQSRALQGLAGETKAFIEKKGLEQAPKEAQAFINAKQRVHELAPAQEIFSDAALRDMRRQPITMTNYIANILQTRGNSSLAVVFNQLSDILGPMQAAEIMRRLGTSVIPNEDINAKLSNSNSK